MNVKQERLKALNDEIGKTLEEVFGGECGFFLSVMVKNDEKKTVMRQGLTNISPQDGFALVHSFLPALAGFDDSVIRKELNDECSLKAREWAGRVLKRAK